MRPVIGKPWTYTKEMVEAIEKDKAMTKNETFLAPVYEAVQKGTTTPRISRPLQSLNGRRVDRSSGVIRKDSGRVLPPVPKNYTEVARAKRIKKKTSKTIKGPKK